MKWFKHETNANTDAKLRKLRMKYGMEGYGVYWYCLELIGATVEPHNLTFELEHDAEVIAHDTNIHYERIEEMMRYMVELGLFELEGVIITCLKMAVKSDEYTQKLLRGLTKSGQTPDKLRTNSGQSPDKVPSNRIEKNRLEDSSNTFTPPTFTQVLEYFTENKLAADPEDFFEYYSETNWIKKNGDPIKSWKLTARTWSKHEKSKNPQPDNITDLTERAIANGGILGKWK